MFFELSVIRTMDDIKNPTISEPVSPIKIFFLSELKLNFKNPVRLPMIEAHKITAIILLAFWLIKNKKPHAIIPKPPARPSIPSIRL